MSTRRYFVYASAAIAATARYAYPQNNAIRVGAIGTGGRCRTLLKSLKTIPGVTIAALCDIWSVSSDAAREHAAPQPFVTNDYQDLLGRKDIDAVVIGTPEHWHVPMTIDALRAGKDVYIEKPLSHDLFEAQTVAATVKETGRVLQVGMQQRSMPHFQEGYDIVRAGKLGQIHKVQMAWNRNHFERMRRPGAAVDPSTVDWRRFLGRARPQPFDAYRFRNWRWFWDFGGGVNTDLMTHYLDVANWYLDLGHPEHAYSVGSHAATAGLWETPDTVLTVLQYPTKKLTVQFEATFANRHEGNYLRFLGSEGNLYLDRGRLELRADGADSKLKPHDRVLGQGERGLDFYTQPDGELLHLTDWVRAIRREKQPSAPAEAGLLACEPGQLANLSLRTQNLTRMPKA